LGANAELCAFGGLDIPKYGVRFELLRLRVYMLLQGLAVDKGLGLDARKGTQDGHGTFRGGKSAISVIRD